MRTYWLGLAALLFTVGCTHDGKLRPQAGAVPLTENGTAATLTEQGVTLVAYGSSWKGAPHTLERYFTPLEIRLENHSGRPLSIRYADFELDGQKSYVAREPNELGRILASRSISYRASQNQYGISGARTYQAQSGGTTRMQPKYDTTYPTRGSTPSSKPTPCYTCTTMADVGALPSPDMLQQAFTEGPLEDGQIRKGFLYFEEPLRLDDHVTLKVKLVDAATGEPFGSLSVPFDVL
jgi:hypothetical protein